MMTRYFTKELVIYRMNYSTIRWVEGEIHPAFLNGPVLSLVAAYAPGTERDVSFIVEIDDFLSR